MNLSFSFFRKIAEKKPGGGGGGGGGRDRLCASPK